MKWLREGAHWFCIWSFSLITFRRRQCSEDTVLRLHLSQCVWLVQFIQQSKTKECLCFSLVVLKATLASVLTCMSKLRALSAFTERLTHEFIQSTQLKYNLYHSGYRKKITLMKLIFLIQVGKKQANKIRGFQVIAITVKGISRAMGKSQELANIFHEGSGSKYLGVCGPNILGCNSSPWL